MKNDYFKTIDELSKIYKTVSSVQNLSFLQQYASLLEPVTKSIDIASLSQQLTSVSTLFSDTASIQDMISASKSLVDVLPHLDGITSSVNLKGAFSKEEVQSLMDGITFQNEHIKINSSAIHTLESVPDSVPLEDNKQLQQTVDSSQNTENVAVSFRNDSVVVLKNKDFVNVYGKPLAQWFLSNFMSLLIGIASSNLTSDAPMVISAIETASVNICEQLDECCDKIIDSINQIHIEHMEAANLQNHYLKIIAENTSKSPEDPVSQNEDLVSPPEDSSY